MLFDVVVFFFLKTALGIENVSIYSAYRKRGDTKRERKVRAKRDGKKIYLAVLRMETRRCFNLLFWVLDLDAIAHAP